MVQQAVIDSGLRVQVQHRYASRLDADVDTRTFQSAVLDGKVFCEVSGLMRFGIGETRLDMAGGSQRLSKARRYAKNDMFASSCLAVSHAVRNPIRTGKARVRAYVTGMV